MQFVRRVASVPLVCFWLVLVGVGTLASAQTNVPTLTSLAPNTAQAGAPGLTLVVNGVNFNRLTSVRWNGVSRVTTFVSVNQLTAVISTVDLATPGIVQVTAFNDGAGGGSSNPLPFTITPGPPPAPTLISLAPSSASAGSPAFTLTLTGANFFNNSIVRWNGANRVTAFLSATQLTAQIPASDIANPGIVNVTVLTPPNTAGLGGGSSSIVPFTITPAANPVPVLTSLNPNAATAGSAALTLTLTGSNFIAGSVVRWNGANRPTTVVSASQLTAQIPASDLLNAGSALVSVNNPPNAGVGGGTSNALPFTINQPPAPVPVLTSLNPNMAVEDGPAFTLTVTGRNFVNTSAVRWNGVNRPTVFMSATQLTAQIPASDLVNEGTASVTVFNLPNNLGLGGGASNALPFTLTQTPAPVPVLTSLTPSSANAGGSGFALMLSGSNFINTSVVRWNDAERPTTFISATQLIAQIPASDIASAGSATVRVVNPRNGAGGGGSSGALQFAVNQAANPLPTLASVLPNPLTAGTSGTTLTLIGSNFVANSVARWNGANRPTMFVSATQLTVQLSAADLANAGTASVTVFNPAPGGGLSNAVTVNVNNPAPVVTSLIPNSVVAGSAAFTLTLNGSGFIPASQIRWNGANRPTVFVSGNQLTTQVAAADVLNVGAAQVTVFNPAPGGGTSAGATLTITPKPLPPPTLLSVTASAVAQGVRQVRLTLIGRNFRPGARVVIGQTTSNTALVPATDILVESVNRANENTLYAIVSVANNATLINRAVDVVNADNTNTAARGSATTQALRVLGGTSLGAPVQITSVLIVHPRTGTIIQQNEPLFAEAVLAGAGTGTVIGQWLWDGNVVEQFAINFTAGERKLIRNQNPLPTIYLGPHRLELKLTSPNLIQAPPVQVIINNGTWKLLRLLEPKSGAGFIAEKPPALRWTLVPGAMRYQIGFSTDPYFNKITRWHDVTGNEWQVPLDFWSTLPEGELWWTARVVETSGNTRQPAAMRRIARLTPNALRPATLGTPTGTTLLEWQPIRAAVIYRVTITSDVAGKLVIKRFATANAKIDVKKLLDKFQPGVLYFWRVEAFNLKGRLVTTSEWYNFLPKPQQTGMLLQVEQMRWQLPLAEQAASLNEGLGTRAPQRAALGENQLVPAGLTISPSPLGSARSLGSVPTQDGNESPDGSTPFVVPPSGGSLESGILPPEGGTTNLLAEAFALSAPPAQNQSTTQTTQQEQAAAQANQLASKIAARTPLPDQTVTSATPPVQVDFKTPIQPSEASLQIDDTDYSALAKITDRQIAFTPTIPLGNGQHQILVSVGAEAAGWFFTVNAAATATEPDPETKGTDAEQETASTAATNAEAAAAEAAAAEAQPAGDTAPVPVVEKELTWEATSNQQDISGSEQDTHDLSLGMQGRYKNGPWLTEMNGTGLLNSLISPNPRHSLGRFNDYIFHFAREWPGAKPLLSVPSESGAPVGPKWAFDIRFGMVSPQSYLNAEYVSTGFAREGVEVALKTPAGTFGFYRNTNDKGQGEGIGFGYRQRVNGGSYDAPSWTKDPERVKFRLMWLGANDVGGHPLKTGYDEEGHPITQIDPFATPRTGDSYGGLLSVKLNKDWNWVSEYAITSNNVNRLAPDAQRQFGRAWRSGFTGTWHKANLSVAFRDVSPNYSIPATASLTQLSASDRRGVDFSISRDSLYGTFSGQYQYLQSDFRYDDRAHIGLNNVNLGWTKQLTQTTVQNSTFSTQLSLGGNLARTTTSNREREGITGLANQGRDGVNVSVTETIQTQQLGTLSLTVGGSRNWFRDTVNERANNIITSVNVSTSWIPKDPWFQWQANVSVNWLAGERFSTGASRTLTAYIQPTFNWARFGLSLTPLVTLNQLSSQMLLLPDLSVLEAEAVPLALPRRMTTGDMWMTQHGGRLAWQLPGKLRFNTLSFEGSQAWMRDGLSGMTQRTPRLLFLWTLVQPAKPAPPREEPPAQEQAQPQPQPDQAAPTETIPTDTPAGNPPKKRKGA
jgi:hypothetical protein